MDKSKILLDVKRHEYVVNMLFFRMEYVPYIQKDLEDCVSYTIQARTQL